MNRDGHQRELGSKLTDEVARAAGDLTRPYALLDFPHHGNLGDSAIWAGERRVLEALYGAAPAYTGGVGCFALENMRRRVGPEGTLFLHGGGNFGDLWERHELFRERVIRSMSDHRIVVLAQTLHFQDPSALDRARSVIDAHPSITVLLRDRESFEVARRDFQCTVRLCPDGATGIGPIPRTRPASVEVLQLFRRDKERKWDPSRFVEGISGQPIDWLDRVGTPVERLDRGVRRWRGHGSTADRLLHRLSRALGERAVRSRLRRAVDLLCHGRVVVTDRLHGHVLSSLLHIPNVLLDNSYGKNRRYWETWCREDPLSRFCERPNEAVELARELGSVASPDASPAVS